MKANLTAINSRGDKHRSIGLCTARARQVNDAMLTADSASSLRSAKVARALTDGHLHEREYVTPDDFKDWSVPRT